MGIYVTKSFLPSKDEVKKYIDKIWDSGILTNQGPLLCEFENEMKKFLELENFHFLTNGTLALQLALSSLDINDGEIITTPFSYVATTSSILWQRCKPIFVDIEADNFTIDPNKIEEAITEKTKAIMAVHVFGYAADVETIQAIANKHNLKVIYDGAHAFGVKYNGKSLLSYGDVSTLSFHATKLFHTIEGGACVINDKSVSDKLELQKRFGHHGDDHFCLGMNAKANEFQAAIGLVNFQYIEQIISERKRISELYDRELAGLGGRPKPQANLDYNYAYYPIVFKSEDELLKVLSALKLEEIYPRRYFHPSLNTLPYVEHQSCPISEDTSARIACLPLYIGLLDEEIIHICKIIKDSVI